MKKKILITGASGFIGSFIVDEALRRGYTVVAGVRATSSRMFLTHPDLQFITLAYESTGRLTEQLRKEEIDFAVHCAGTTGTKGDGGFATINFHYTRNLLDALNATQQGLNKLIYVSTLAVHGPGDPVTRRPIALGDQEVPITEYGKSKLQAEQYIVSNSKFPFSIIRPTGVYGPRDRDFLTLFKWIQRGIELSLGGQQQMLSLIYVKDLAAATVALMEKPSTATHYLASDGAAYEAEDLGRYIRLILNKKTIRLHIPGGLLHPLLSVSDAVHRMAGRHPFLSREKVKEVTAANWLCDSSALWKDLSSRPAYTLEHGLRETVDWYKSEGWL